MKEYLATLNPEQQKAVLHTKGPLLIVAGAGTGKTKTLTHRIYHLIQEGVHPQNILAITFTNKAAQEMRERVRTMLSTSPHSLTRVSPLLSKERGRASKESRIEMPFMSTFHALGVYLLRHHPEKVGLVKNFTILDSSDQKALIKEAMNILDINPKQWEPRRIQSMISRNKGDAIKQPDFARGVNSELTEITSMVWEKYDKLLAENKAVDFDDLLVKSYNLLRDNPDILEYYQDKWQYIHIDEYQDTNAVQYRMSKLLAKKHQNICVVGDGDQNIYSWRGADMRNILNFEKDYPNAEVIILETNYRSTQTILSAADDIIKKNKARVPKILRTDNEEGNQIKLYTGFSENMEAKFVAEHTARQISLGAQPHDIAVLFRTNFQSRVLEEAFMRADIPYRVLGVKFFDRKEIKDVLAYIRAALNPESLPDIKRVINLPKRGIGKVTIAKIFAGKADTLAPAVQKKYHDFQKTLGEIARHAVTQQVSETIKFTIKKSGFEDELLKGGEDDLERLANMKELVSYATRYDELEPEAGIQKLLEDASLMGEQDSLMTDEGEIAAVRLMTIHASKGLEFEHVFVTGLEQGLFPSQRDSGKKEDNEEERRLMYVAVTRAKKNLYLSHARSRRIYGEQEMQAPSEFLTDISELHIEHVADEWSDFQDEVDRGERTIYLDF